MNIAQVLRESARMYPDRPAVRLDELVISYAELDDLSARAAGLAARARGRARRPGGHHAARTSPSSRSSTTACCAPAAPWCR